MIASRSLKPSALGQLTRRVGGYSGRFSKTPFLYNSRPQRVKIHSSSCSRAKAATASLNSDGSIQYTWGTKNQTYKFNPLYLRDHCPCDKCRHPDTKQRSIDTFSIPNSIQPKSVENTTEGLKVVWNDEDHSSIYPGSWLSNHTPKPLQEMPNLAGETQRIQLFDATIAKNPPSVDYKAIMEGDEGVREWTSKILQYGFCYIDNTPVLPEATAKLIERIAFIRPTHYGGFWDFTADLASADTAYTTLPLGAHTDTTYFTDPAGLQLFHLLSHTAGRGGASLLVDGYRAALTLRDEDPAAFDTLATVPIRSHASGNEGVTITSPTYTVLSAAEAWGAVGGEAALPLHGGLIEWPVVRWNNDDRAAMTHLAPKDVERWYAAARKWAEVLRRPEMEYWQQLEPGRPVVFNNQRVLHGRSAFNGKRRMCGAYVNMDDFISRWKNLNFERKDLLNMV